MLRTRQFSLGYLLLEIFWVALALGISRAVFLSWHGNWGTPAELQSDEVLVPLTVFAWSAAIGGMFGRMTAGIAVGVLLLWLSFLLLPVVLWEPR